MSNSPNFSPQDDLILLRLLDSPSTTYDSELQNYFALTNFSPLSLGKISREFSAQKKKDSFDEPYFKKIDKDAPSILYPNIDSSKDKVPNETPPATNQLVPSD